MKPLSLFLPLLFCSAVLPAKPGPVFDMEEMRDASTLRVKVLQDWKKVGGMAKRVSGGLLGFR